MSSILSYFHTPNEYALLPSSIAKPPNRGWRHVLIPVILVASISFNFFFFFFWPPKYTVKVALDNYQSLNHNPIVDLSLLPLSSPNEPLDHAHEQHAVVTSLYTDAFAGAVATLGHSLRKVNTTARLVLLYFPDRVSPSALCIATSTGFVPHAVTRIPPPHDGRGVYPHFLDQFTKLNVWTLDALGIRSLVYLDADTLVRRNFDELFTLPWMFAATPDVFVDWKGFTLAFNAGVLFLRPSTAIFNDMISKLSTAHYPLADAEQSFLNHYFAAEVVRLPYHYNANLAIKARALDLWEGTRHEHRIVHFTLVKPFIGRGPQYKEVPFDEVEKFVEEIKEVDGGAFREEMVWWGETFVEMKQVYAPQLALCKAAD
ncbi:hypothetical protein EUX98_g1122 [Antrodiella citrinella]|uniref:Glycosyltransferase family 8 protein n=1 Tax=Antrodiella citrinella TaxID=2447956 RepID=A0A4S4N288_9APHY|nr:hypothetical protein EUX98_g1122 [Antrodiella citrinella]